MILWPVSALRQIKSGQIQHAAAHAEMSFARAKARRLAARHHGTAHEAEIDCLDLDVS